LRFLIISSWLILLDIIFFGFRLLLLIIQMERHLNRRRFSILIRNGQLEVEIVYGYLILLIFILTSLYMLRIYYAILYLSLLIWLTNYFSIVTFMILSTIEILFKIFLTVKGSYNNILKLYWFLLNRTTCWLQFKPISLLLFFF
jgi:hypothetical protein